MKTIFAIFTIVVSLLFSLVTPYVILSVASLYSIAFITQFSYLQVFGVLAIISMVKLNIESNKYNKDEEFGDVIIKLWAKLLSWILSLLMLWGISTLMYYIIK